MRSRRTEGATNGCRRRHVALAAAMVLVAVPAAAQDAARPFAGALVGVSTLSADGRTALTASTADVSLYDPANGPAVNLVAGIHVAQYFSLQASWMWNRNDVTLVSSFTTPHAGGWYEQRRKSRQHAIVFDGLIYFRRRDSAIRPYLGTGLSVVHFSSEETAVSSAHGLAPPPRQIESTKIGIRSHVGIDFALSRTWAFRYSFSETISGNPISPSLTPPGRRGLMNFQNLFGIVGSF